MRKTLILGRLFQNKNDWYKFKSYPHFDEPLRRNDAWRIVRNFINGQSYGFYPLIQFSIKQARYRTKKILLGNKYIKIQDKAKSVEKYRIINYPSHKDGYIFSYYAQKLSKLYEDLISQLKISECIVAYRKGIGSNINIASNVFQYIDNIGSCIVLTYDIKGFFDNLNHLFLKQQIERVLNVKKLPNDYYKKYKTVTKYKAILKEDLINENGKLNKPVCTIKELHKFKTKIITNTNDFGIPQGTQVSALFSNIYMLDFDRSMMEFITLRRGIYRRYADDIIIIVPIKSDEQTVLTQINSFVQSELNKCKLQINESKSEQVIFKSGRISNNKPYLQYLGFLYTGNKILIRHGSISKYWRKLLSGIRRKRIIANQNSEENTVYKTSLYHQYSHLGSRNFYDYVRHSDKVFCMNFQGRVGIKHQVRKHMTIIKKEIQGIRTTKHHKSYCRDFELK